MFSVVTTKLRPFLAPRIRIVFVGLIWAACSVSRCEGLDLARDLETSPRWLRVEPTMQWCGARAVWIAAQSHGIDVPFSRVLRNSNPTKSGESSLYDLIGAIDSVGLASRTVHCNIDTLTNSHALAITVHKSGPETLHAYLVVGVENNTLFLVDPFKPAILLKVSPQEFSSQWTGETIFIAKNQADLKFASDRTASFLRTVMLSISLGLLLTCLLLSVRSGRTTVRSAAMGILVLLGMSSVGCGSHPPPNPLRFQVLDLDAGSGFDTETIRREFRFTNAGDKPLRIVDVKTSCTCTATSFTEGQIGPGESGVVTLEARLSGLRGEFRVAANVLATDDADAEGLIRQQVTMSMRVVPEWTALPDHLVFNDVEPRTKQRRTSISRQYRIDTPSTAVERLIVKPTGVPGLVVTVDEPQRERKDAVETVEALVNVEWTPEFAGMTIRETIRIVDSSASHFCDISVYGTSSHPDFLVSPQAAILTSGQSSTVDVRLRDSTDQRKLEIRAEDAASGLRIDPVAHDSGPLLSRFRIHLTEESYAQSPCKKFVRIQLAGQESAQYRLEVVCLPK